MAKTRELVTISMDKEMHSKLILLSFAKQYGLNEKNMSMSEIINISLNEYMENHKDEINLAMKEYEKRGWYV